MFKKEFWQREFGVLSKYLGLIEKTDPDSEYFNEKGYSKQAESLGNFLLNSAPDGRGVVIFDPDTEIPQWSFVKISGLISAKDELSLVYRGIDYSMELGTKNMLSLLTVPLANDGSFDASQVAVLSYHVQGRNVQPYTEQESSKMKSGLAQMHNMHFKTGSNWRYNPASIPVRPSLLKAP